jgi:hypothetical protein
VQESELHNDEEQEDDTRQTRIPEVLFDVPEAHAAQGDEVSGPKGEQASSSNW